MDNFSQGPFGAIAPVFFTPEGMPLPIQGMYRGACGFLVSNGPSLKKVDLTRLKLPGIVTIGLNNGPSVFRPNLHVCGDQPCRFIKQIWLDPYIMKVVPFSSFNAYLWDNDTWEPLKRNGRLLRVGECPNVVGIHRNCTFRPEVWLNEDTFGWGCSGKNGGGRSVFLLAIKLAYMLGLRRLFIVGADFKMEPGEDKGYAFAQVRCKGAARMNNKNYVRHNKRCCMLKPFFDQAGFLVYNVTPASGLTAFPYMPYEDAVRIATTEHVGVVKNPRTEDMYLEWEHPAKFGKTESDVKALPEKEQKNYARRQQEWIDRLNMYAKDGKQHLIPKHCLRLIQGDKHDEKQKDVVRQGSKTTPE